MKQVLALLILWALQWAASSLSLNPSPARRALSVALVAASLIAPPPFHAAAAEVPLYYSKAQSFYDSWNNRDIEGAISFFADDVYFVDAQYSHPFEGRADVRAYLQECADSLPGWKFIIDDYSEDIVRRRVGLKWHVSDSSRTPLPFPSRGVSFLEFNEQGLISGCTDMVEPTVKTGFFQLPLLRVVSAILGTK